MSPYAAVILVIVLATALGYGLILLRRGIKLAGDRRRRRSRAPGPGPGPEPGPGPGPGPGPEPIERLAANLRRLRAELEDMENRPGIPAEDLRLQALRGAYVDGLETACHRLHINPPQGATPAGSERARQAEIYRVEAELRRQGLDVREPASR